MRLKDSELGISEEEMRRALGLAPAEARDPTKVVREVRKKKADKPEKQKSYVYLRYSVRKKTGGAPFSYEFKSSSISAFEAKIEAEKEIRKKGLEVWALLDCEQVNI